jgi:hypothetical protein
VQGRRALFAKPAPVRPDVASDPVEEVAFS